MGRLKNLEGTVWEADTGRNLDSGKTPYERELQDHTHVQGWMQGQR